MDIKINIIGLEENRTKLIAIRNDSENAADKLDTLIESLESSWDGDASKKFISSMKKYSKKIAKFNEAIEGNVEYIHDVKDSFEETDKKATKKIENCF